MQKKENIFYQSSWHRFSLVRSVIIHLTDITLQRLTVIFYLQFQFDPSL